MSSWRPKPQYVTKRANPHHRRCRSCGAVIIWCFTVEGKRIPLDAAPVGEGPYVVDQDRGKLTARKVEPLFDGDRKRFESHFRTCPNATRHSKGKG